MLGNKKVGEGAPTFVVAEAGLNHNGQLDLAKKLVQKAVEVKADAIKFQTYITEEFVSRSSPDFTLFKRLELRFSDFKQLADLSNELGITFLSTPLDFRSSDFLEEIGVPAFKVASCDITNIPFLEHIAKKDRPIILSTGMAFLQEVAEAVKAIYSTGNRDLVLLHCLSNYPANIDGVNLRAMHTLKTTFEVPVGFSDHTSSSLTPLAAVAAGASLIEKHFTVDKNLPGPDHRCSFNVDEFRDMVDNIRNVEKMLGSSIKRPLETEVVLSKLARRSIIAKVHIPKGTRIGENMIAIRRPGHGIPPRDAKSVIGRIARVDIDCEEIITWDKLF